MPLYVPLAKPTDDDEVLRVDVMYHSHHVKERQGTYLSVVPGKLEKDGISGFTSWTCFPMRSARLLWQQMDRRNAKVNQRCWNEVQASIKHRVGKAWDFVADYCAKMGLELAQNEQPVVA